MPSCIDLRDLYLPHGGPRRLTPRRLLVLLAGLPPDALFRAALKRAEVEANKPTLEQLRARQRHYDEQAKVGDVA